MKRSRILIVSSIATILIAAGIAPGRAQELFKAVLSTTCVSSNQNGSLVYQHTGNQELIRSCAADQGITDLNGLSLVFNQKVDALQVVAPTNLTSVGTNHVLVGTNQFLICTPLTFSNVLSLTGTNTNKVELLASVFVESNSVAGGTLAATERSQFDTNNQLTAFSLVGRIQYAVAANGTNSAEICTGVLAAGTFLGNNEDMDEDNDQDNGGNQGNQGGAGNHGNGNHGHHGKK